jgi:hypothetical protein
MWKEAALVHSTVVLRNSPAGRALTGILGVSAGFRIRVFPQSEEKENLWFGHDRFLPHDLPIIRYCLSANKP